MADAGGNIATAGSGLDLGSATSLDRAVSAAQASAAKSMSEYAAATKAAAARGAERQKALDAIVADMPAHADFAKLASEIPSAPKLPEQPAMPQGNAWQNFGSTASVLGILGSMLLKLPIRDSLNASAAAMNAKTKGDWADYQANYARWKDATDLAIKQADWESKRFAEALDLMKSDSAAGEAAARTVAAATNNDAAMAVLQSGDPKLQAEYFDGLAKLSESMQAHADAVEMQHQRLIASSLGTPQQLTLKSGKSIFAQQDKAGVLGAPGAWYTADQARAPIDIGKDPIVGMATASQAMPEPPEDVKKGIYVSVAQGVPVNKLAPGFGTAAARQREDYINGAIKYLEDTYHLDAAKAGVLLAQNQIKYEGGKTTTVYLTKMLGTTRQAVAQLDYNADKASEEMKKLGSTNVSPVFNAIARGEQRWTGNPAYSSLFFYLSAFTNEAARILSSAQASTAQLHTTAVEEAQRWSSINMTPKAFEAVRESVKNEGAFRIHTYTEALKAALPGSEEGADSDVKAALQAAGRPYEPDKYDYRIAPDGSVQRKVK